MADVVQARTARHPGSLTDARLQLHWATQCVSASADRKLDRRDDDGQSNLGYDAVTRTLVTHPFDDGYAMGIVLDEPALVALKNGTPVDATPLPGKTLVECLAWASKTEPLADEGPVAPRDYDMPEHPFAVGERFDASDREAFTALAGWTAFGFAALEAAAGEREHTEPRLWPHHFDVGTIVPLAGDPRALPSVGPGFSLGDASYDRPYFYVNAYLEDADPPAAGDCPDPPPGMSWADGWFGLVLSPDAEAELDATVETLRRAIRLAAELASGEE